MPVNKFNPIIRSKEDSLHYDNVGQWSEKKYKLLGHYLDYFVKVKHKWGGNINYLDLFSSSGKVYVSKQIGNNQKKYIYGSPLLALSHQVEFRKYIFCEEDANKINALKIRIEKEFKDRSNKVTCIKGDSNSKETLEKIIKEIERGLTLCFVDPYGINIHFKTLKKIADNAKTDFFVLLAYGMDLKRNINNNYMQENNNKVSHFLGMDDWKEKIKDKSNSATEVVKLFDTQMEKLGYKIKTKKINITEGKNVSLYHLALYTKSEIGKNFWDIVSNIIEVNTLFS